MSLTRLVYYSAVIGGWAAFLAWLIAEFALLRNSSTGNLEVALTGALVGGAIGAGLAALAGMANGHWKQVLPRMVPGFIGGALGGVTGGLIGNFLFTALGLPRALGWLAMGLGIGCVEGLYEHSPSKIRNGLIGGGIGGLIGGILFDPMLKMIQSGSGMSSRATAFVILGICIGALIGLVQVALKEAWLTVADGYRSGRQLILSRPVTILGRGDHVPLPFLGLSNKDLEVEHVRISRQGNGRYVVEDNKTRLGTRVNGNVVQSPVTLKDGDIIKFGTNFVRFNERQRKVGSESVSAQGGFNAPVPAAPPPPAMKRDPVVLTAPKTSSATATGAGGAPPGHTETQEAPLAGVSSKTHAPAPVVSVTRTPPPAPPPTAPLPRAPISPGSVKAPPPPKSVVPASVSPRPPEPSSPTGPGAATSTPPRPFTIPRPPPPPPRKG